MFDWQFFLEHVFNLGPTYRQALVITVVMAVVSQLFGMVVGALIAAARLQGPAPLRWLAVGYTWVMRSIPELVILVLLFSGLAAAGIYQFGDRHLFSWTISGAFQAAVVGLGLREGAYMSEIYRMGFRSVDRRQVAAARALGLSRHQTLWKVVVPQAMRVMVPPFGNSFFIMIKLTSLASVIGVNEIFLTTNSYASATFKVFELMLGLAVNYLILTGAWTLIQAAIEARLNRHSSGADRGFVTTLRSRLGASAGGVRTIEGEA